MRRTRELITGMRRLTLPSAAAIAAVATLLGAPSPARAGDKDPDGLVAVAESLSDFVSGKSKDAIKKLEDALKACQGAACEAGTRAQLGLAIGIVEGAGLKDNKKALAAFEAALKEDPKAQPDRQFMTPALNKLFSEAQKNVKRASMPGGATRPPPSKEQMAGVAAATGQLNGKDWSSCMGTIIAAMGENEFAAGKLLLAQCEDAGGLLLEATGDARLALKYAEEEANPDLKKKATELVARLVNDTPAIIVQMPKTVDDPVLTVDGVVIPADKVDKPIPHNPGKATIQVKGKKGTFPYDFKSTESFDRGERVTVNADTGGGTNTSAIQQCLASARNASDLNRCIESGGKGRGLTLHGGLEVASYNDNVSVDVIAPTLFFSAENPTAGWQVAATYGVDVVSNASPDIVATASRRFDEIRHAGTLAAEVKIGPTRVGLNGGVSIEPDYIGRGVGASVSADVFNKQITPTLSYHLGFDIMGRCGADGVKSADGTAMKCTPFSVFSRNILTHAIDLSSSIITSPNTVFLVAGTLEFMMGDTSKPYRHIPMFDAATAAGIPRGATAALINKARLPYAPLEQVPDSRDRFAVLGRVSHRFEKATIRADERLYLDNWGLKASTTDARYFYDVAKTLRVGPHARFHIQNGVDFWERAYVATPGSSGPTLPKFRTLDREISPLLAATLGGALRWQAAEIFSINVVAEGIYTQFLDTIYVYDRWAFFSATTLELGFE
jgi:tetratricopeptide (TPR) repeat protein